MATTQTETVLEQLNTLAIESSRTFVDAAYLAQRQSAELAKAWLNTLSSTQETQRDIYGRWIRQAQEAQGLWQELVREYVRSGGDTFARVARNGATAARETASKSK